MGRQGLLGRLRQRLMVRVILLQSGEGTVRDPLFLGCLQKRSSRLVSRLG
jgi:hypothetical protein